MRNDLVRCGSFFPFREKIFYKRSELFAIHFSATSTGLDTKQNQNQKQAKSKCGCIRELHNVLLRRYNRYLFFLLKKNCFSINFFNALVAMDSPDMFSSRRHPKHSTAEYCLILFSFLVMFKAEYCFVPFLNKICLVLSSAQCIDSLLSINHSQEAFRCFSIELTFLLLKRRQVSSAYGRKYNHYS